MAVGAIESIKRISVDRAHQIVFLRGAYVSILPKRPSGESFAECRYELEVEGKIGKGVVTSKGVIEHEVPRTARTAALRIWASKDPEEKPLEWLLDIDKRPPVDTFEGVCWRLENLGFDCGEETSEGPATRKAARAFMEWMGLMSAEEELEQTGTVNQEMDLTPEFRKALDQEYQHPAGLHHGAELVGDDQLDSQKEAL